MNKITPKQIKDDHIIVIGAGMSGIALGSMSQDVAVVEKDLTTPKVPQGFFVSHQQFKGFEPVKMQILYLGEDKLHADCSKELEAGYREKIYGATKFKSSASKSGQFMDVFLPNDWQKFYDKMLDRSTVCEAALEGVNRKAKLVKIGGSWIKYKALVYTIPLPFMLDMAKVKCEDIFDAVPFISATIPVKYKWKNTGLKDAPRNFVIYDCRPDSDYWRITAYHNKLMVEMRMTDKVSEAGLLEFVKELQFEVTGGISLHRSVPGKIKCSNDELRKKYLRILAKYDIIPLGRYAAWKKEYYLTDSIRNARSILDHYK